MKIQIKTILGELIFEGDFSSIAKAIEAALDAKKSLRSANLRYANLRYANLRYANLRSANLSYANLSYADLSYANLSYADLSSANLSSANLSYANLRYANLRSANLSYADLRSANLRSANLSSANLRYANLSYANLRSANLSSANLRSANLGSADLSELLKIPRINSRILEAVKNGGTLNMSTWHTCETTHCRAGWAIHLLGEKGKLLEAMVGPSTAGALIYAASDDGRVPEFHCSDDEAIADLKTRAAKETAASVKGFRAARKGKV